MNIDFDRIEKIYGSSIINSIALLKDDVIDNIKYFISLGFEDTEDIFERQVLIFICPKEEFRVKINNLIKKLGNNYIEEIEKIIKVCRENNIPVTGNVFKKPAEEIEKIIKVCRENNIPITGSVFYKTAEDIEKIIKVCIENNIPITGSIFLKSTEEIEKSINYIKENYGQAYLTPLIINKNVEHLKNVLPYLESLGVLPYVVKSASILTLTLDEIKERKDFVESNNDTLVLQNGRFNSVFGLSKANYKKLTNKSSITK